MARDLLPLVQRALGDKYVIERQIGRGGAARVYLAHDKAGQKLALKVLHPELKVSVMADRFLRDIRLVAQLHHPLIVPVIDSGEHVPQQKTLQKLSKAFGVGIGELLA